MKKISTMQAFSNEILKEQKLTIGLDLGDRWSFYCVLDEAGKIILEQKVATTPEAMKQTFAKIPRSLIALETGTHSPWVSRLLEGMGQAMVVANARKLRMIYESKPQERPAGRAHAGAVGPRGRSSSTRTAALSKRWTSACPSAPLRPSSAR